MDIFAFNKLPLEEKCKIIQEYGRFVCCRGIRDEATVNVYSLRNFVVEVAIHNVLCTIMEAKARVVK